MPAEKNYESNTPEIIYVDRYIPIEVRGNKNSKMMQMINESEDISTLEMIDRTDNVSQLNIENENYNPVQFASDKIKLNAELMGIRGWNEPQANIFPEEYNKLNNLNINLLYDISDNFKAGLGFAQETYHTVYKGTEADGSIYRYYQQPNLSTFSLVAKYTPFEYNNVAPYIQTGLGFNQTGYVFSPSIGAELRLYPSFSFIVGMDYKLLGFTHQNKWFYANKYGLRYGFSFNF